MHFFALYAYMFLPCLIVGVILWGMAAIYHAAHPDPYKAEALKKQRKAQDPLARVSPWIWLVLILVVIAKAC